MTDANTVFSGLCAGGPLDGRHEARRGIKHFEVDNATEKAKGFYAYVPGRGVYPATWRWIKRDKEYAV